MSKFTNLRVFFEKSKENEITLTFDEISRIIGEPLADSAYNHRAYWNDSKTHMFPKAWISSGYLLKRVDMVNQIAIFESGAK